MANTVIKIELNDKFKQKEGSFVRLQMFLDSLRSSEIVGDATVSVRYEKAIYEDKILTL